METLMNFFGIAVMACGLVCLFFGSKVVDLIPFFSRIGYKDEFFTIKSLIVLLVGLGIVSLNIISWIIIASMVFLILIVHFILMYREKLKQKEEEKIVFEQKAITQKRIESQKQEEEKKQKRQQERQRALELFESGIYNLFVYDALDKPSTDSWCKYLENIKFSCLIEFSEIKQQAFWNPVILEYFLLYLNRFFDDSHNDEDVKIAIKIMERFEIEVKKMNYPPLNQILNHGGDWLSRYYLKMKSNLKQCCYVAV